MSTRFLASLLLSAVLAAGCSAAPVSVPDSRAAEDRPCVAEGSAAAAVAALTIDDMRQFQNLLAEARKLKESKAAVPMATLVTQLKNNRCALDLPTPATPKLSPEAIYQTRKDSVLIIGDLYKCTKCTRWHAGLASAFAIADDVCVTNYHVVSQPKTQALLAMTIDGRAMPVKAVLASSKSDDVAILRLETGGAKLKPLPLAAPAAVGSRVWVISHPDGRFYTLSEGIISRYFAYKASESVPMMAITADYAKGSSGAPLLNECGEVVGMVASTSSIYYSEKDGHGEDLQMVVKQCVPVASIRKLIQK